MLPPPPPTCDLSNTSPELCELFLNHFINKVNDIRKQISAPNNVLIVIPDLSPTNRFNSFSTVSLPYLFEVLCHMKTTTCSLDVIPTRFLKDVFSVVGPSILSIINLSLTDGIVPCSFKHVVVQPLLKKPNLSTSDFNNFRPISKLPFLSKILEKVVCNQILDFMVSNNIFEKFQSGFRALHSTETALLKVSNDLHLAADTGESAILIL